MRSRRSDRPAPAGWARFYRIVRRIPRGRVATYGLVAIVAGQPRSARHVGYALAALRDTRNDVPWHRVLGHRARGFAGVSLRDSIGGAVQRTLLEAEGVGFDRRGRVCLADFGADFGRTGVRGVRSARPSRGPRRSG